LKIISEIGTSHRGDLTLAKELIDASCKAGADIVKTQIVYADEILHKNTGLVKLPSGDIDLYQEFKRLEKDIFFFQELKSYADSLNIEFSASPFGLKSALELIDLKLNLIKIASPELNHIELLEFINDKLKGTDKRVIFSCGVSKLTDIESAINILKDVNKTLMHCIVQYPAKEEEYNLKLLLNLKNIFGIDTATSDHSKDPFIIPLISKMLGASYLEKHFTLSNETAGLDDKIALNVNNFKKMTDALKETKVLDGKILMDEFKEPDIIYKYLNKYVECKKDMILKVLGNGIKKLAHGEIQNYETTKRSLHVLFDLKKGEILNDNNVKALRTEKNLSPGLHPKFKKHILNKKLAKNIASGEGITFDYIGE